jgi:hypothetical protein
MSSGSLNPSRSTRIWIVLLVVLALLSLVAMRRSLGKAMSMKAETTVTGSLPQLKPGEEAKVVLEVIRVAPYTSVEGNVLDKETETIYRRSSKTIKIAFDASTPVVMGKASDVHEGAVLHSTAKMGDDRVLHAEQIVILTGYVKVQ